jgi:TPR repeat protein
VTQSYETAIKWYKKAANENWVTGQWNMGVMYENGYGVAVNINTARYWWKKACDNGLEKACVRL